MAYRPSTLFVQKRAEHDDDDDVDEDATDSDDSQSTTADEHPWGVASETLPDFTPAFNDLFIEWVYTIDLDNEVFTIDNGAHLQLNRIPRPAWINALAHGWHGDRILLPSGVPKEAIADLVEKLPSPSPSMLEMYENLGVSIVQAKGLNAFPPTQRHGPLLRARIFYFLQEAYEHILSATLLSWRPDELPFREIAYAILCLASASLNLSIVPLQQVSQKGRIGYADLKNTNEESEKAEFLAHLGVGCHLEGFPPGSSPDSGMYWFDGALVHLVAQLIDWPELVSAAVACAVEHCQSQRPDQCVNAILMSIEHIVLVRIYPGGRVERTGPLPLFDIEIHTSADASVRYDADDLEELRIRKEKAIKRRFRIARSEQIEKELQNEQSDSDGNEEEDGHNIEDLTSWPAAGFKSPHVKDTETTFMALTHLLEASSRQQMPPSRPKEGIFSTEIYRIILLYLGDVETQQACMQVSRSFRDLCQQNIMMMDNAVFQATDASKTYDQTSTSFPALRMKTVSTGRSQDVTLTRTGTHSGPDKHKNRHWQVVVGSERNRRSLLPELVVALDPIG